MECGRPMIRITFLDDDHVMRLARYLLTWANDDEIEYAERFFHREIVERGTLEDIGRRLGVAKNLVVQLAEGKPPEAVRDSDVIVFRRGRVTAEIMDLCPHLRLIQRLGESAAGIDLQAANTRGILVCCLPRQTLAHVAEHVLMMMLALSRRLLEADGTV